MALVRDSNPHLQNATFQGKPVHLWHDLNSGYWLLGDNDGKAMFIGPDPNTPSRLGWTTKNKGFLFLGNTEAARYIRPYLDETDPVIPYDEIDQEQDESEFPLFTPPKRDREGLLRVLRERYNSYRCSNSQDFLKIIRGRRLDMSADF